MNRPLPPGDCGARGGDPRRERRYPWAVPGAFGLVGGVAQDHAVTPHGPQGGAHPKPGGHGCNLGHLWRGAGLIALLLLLARSGGCGLVLDPRHAYSLAAVLCRQSRSAWTGIPPKTRVDATSGPRRL